MSIKIYYDDIEFRLKGSVKIRKFLEKVIMAENRKSGDLNFVFTDDLELLEINKRYLQHDYFTDVIAFDYGTGNRVNGEVYISIDRVKINSREYGVSLGNEIIRVMIHGLLHLCGYSDGTDEERERINERQEYYLKGYGG